MRFLLAALILAACTPPGRPCLLGCAYDSECYRGYFCVNAVCLPPCSADGGTGNCACDAGCGADQACHQGSCVTPTDCG